jgi:hypothetical protein
VHEEMWRRGVLVPTASVALLLAAVGRYLVLLSRRKLARPSNGDSASWQRSAESFEAVVRKATRASAACVLDCTCATVHVYSRGSFACVVEELSTALDAGSAAAAVAIARSAGVAAAFEVRRELQNFKKALLIVFHDAQRLERTLQRHELYFFRDRECDRYHQHVDASYAAACGARQHAKGLLVAIHDARTTTKLLCCLPRHPDAAEGVDPRLRNMPASFGSWAALTKAEAFADAALADSAHAAPPPALADDPPVVHEPRCGAVNEVDPASGGGARDGDASGGAWHDVLLRAGLDGVMRRLHEGMPLWPAHVLSYVRLVLIAHGTSDVASQPHSHVPRPLVTPATAEFSLRECCSHCAAVSARTGSPLHTVTLSRGVPSARVRRRCQGRRDCGRDATPHGCTARGQRTITPCADQARHRRRSSGS